MKIYYLTNAEINNLKSGLMNKKSKSFSLSQTQSNKESISKTFSSLYKQNKKTDDGHSFEENIHNILKIEYGWTDVINDTHFFYRIIQIGSTKVLLRLGYSKKLIINGRKYKFIFYQNKSLSIFRGYISKRIITNINEKTQETILTLNNVKIKISKVHEIQIDAFFKLNSNNIEKIINGDDIIRLFNNITDDKIKEAKYVCCEIKLNLEQINKLIQQLRKDKNVLEKIIGYEKLIYIGFVGYGKISDNLLAKLKNIKDLDLLILQIKKCNWLNRKLTQNIDWETYFQCKSLKKENSVLKEQFNLLNNRFDLLNNKYDNLCELVKNSTGMNNVEFLGKKRRRKTN